MTTYREAADKSFEKLLDLWNDAKPFNDDHGGGCFWMAGNTFHAAIEYLIATKQPDTYGLCRAANYFFVQRAPKTEPTKWCDEGIWLDDYGWWGIALARAYMHGDILKLPSDLLETIGVDAQNCWIGMNSGWDNSAMIEGLPITGGIWNSSNDHYAQLAGRNSVTQEVFWLLSYYLSVAFGPGYLDPRSNPAFLFSQAKQFNVLFNAEKKVLERFFGMQNPMAIPSNDPKHPKSTPIPEWSWIGDQGLFMHCCFVNVPTAPGMNRQLTEEIAAAVANGSYQVLNEALCPDPAFILDYAAGKGVFMRNLGIINDANHQSMGRTYDDWILTNASAVWNNRYADGQFHYWWDRKAENPIDWIYSTPVSNAVLHASGFNALVACLWENSGLANKTIPTQAAVAAQ